MQAIKQSIGPATSGCIVGTKSGQASARCLVGCIKTTLHNENLRPTVSVRFQSTSHARMLPSSGPMSALKLDPSLESENQRPEMDARHMNDDADFSTQHNAHKINNLLEHSDPFHERHIGPSQADARQMLDSLGYSSMDELIAATVPEDIRLNRPLRLPEAISEHQLVEELTKLANQNQAHEWRSFIGLGYYNCITPAVIMRNLFENPGWTTAYTAYQAEIAQGRLESLMNFQTMVSDLTGMDVANASLLDEATAAAEALQVCSRQDKKKRARWLVSGRCFPQTLAVVKTRASALGIEVDYFDELNDTRQVDYTKYSGVLCQNPNRQGYLMDLTDLIERAHRADCLTVVATDLMACTQMKPPGEMGADLCVGTSQRFGVPLNFGGPHAGFLSCNKSLMRSIPGRIVGLTRDSNGRQAYRFALQTREQHIRRDKATSNICTAQALLANMSAMYAIYHGPEGLAAIGASIHQKTSLLARLVNEQSNGRARIENQNCFYDTLTIRPTSDNLMSSIKRKAEDAKVNLRLDEGDQTVGISLDETTSLKDIFQLASFFGESQNERKITGSNSSASGVMNVPRNLQIPLEVGGALSNLKRQSRFLQHPVFNSCKSEAQLVRYMKELENKDVSLVHSMIPLGSCTMKLNATSEMLASSWAQFAHCHPFQPLNQLEGYINLIGQLEEYLCEITGYNRISFQPNSGAQGEYAGLRCIRSYLDSIGQSRRDICLVPVSAHGTNPASAQMAGFKIKPVKVNMSDGSIDLENLRSKIAEHREELACLMVTYPSTYGVFDSDIRKICDLVHEAGGQVYLDGANMNAQVGICRPGDYGSDVSHLNLHKTFCIPHGGGGPGAGPIGVKEHLAPFLPSHPLHGAGSSSDDSFGTVSASHFGSPAILPISWSYIRLMSGQLERASQMAILNANYMKRRLESDYKILFTGSSGNVAHEFIIDCSEFKRTSQIEATDIAKRLQDFGLHAPTVSWPLSNSLMLEPTECEDKRELDRYCEALLTIRQEIRDIEEGRADVSCNPIKMAPHTQEVICQDKWDRPYSREQAAFPARYQRARWLKVWPTVGRVDDIYGDTNLFCTCGPVDSMNEN